MPYYPSKFRGGKRIGMSPRKAYLPRRFVRRFPARRGPAVSRGFGTAAAADAKYVDVANTAYAIDTSGSIAHLSIVTRGTDINSREGKSFRLTSVQVRGNISADSATALSEYMVMLVWDKQPNLVLPAITAVLVTANSGSFTNRDNASRFVILKKWSGVIAGNSAGVGAGPAIKRIDQYIRFPPGMVCVCTAADTTGAIGNRTTGALYIVSCGNVVQGTADCTANLGFRIGFTEK